MSAAAGDDCRYVSGGVEEEEEVVIVEIVLRCFVAKRRRMYE
jgi:hypothetical protein